MAFAVTDGELRATSTRSRPLNPVTRPFGITTFRGLVSSYEVIYRSQPNVRTVVDWQARQAGDLEPMLTERISAAERKVLWDDDLARLLRAPHPRWSTPKFWRYCFSDLLVFDNWLAVKTKLPGSAKVVALTRLPPNLIEPLEGDWLTPDGFRIVGTSTEFSWDQVVHIAGYNPEDARWGLSPIETLRRTLSEELVAEEARSQFHDRAARLSGWIGRPTEAPEWSEPARERFDSSWRDRLTGNGPEAGSTPVLEEGMVFHQEKYDADALQYIEARKLTGIEVSRDYHVHPSLLGFSDQPLDDAARRGHISDTLGPLVDFVAAETLLQLLPDFHVKPIEARDRLRASFDLDGKLRGDFLVEAEATSRAVGAPWMLRNEARARRNLPPVEGGDELITPLNVISGGRSSPADTAPGTPGLGQASRSHQCAGTGTKALEDLRPSARTWAEQHAATVASNVERQRARFASRHGAGYDATEAFNIERANTELGDDLAGLALDYAAIAAGPTAETLGIDFDITTAEAWLLLNARFAAQGFNAKTLEAVIDAIADGDTAIDDYGEAFDDAAGERADGFGIGRVVTIAGFAANEAATQGGAASKTWYVNSSNSRHGALDGVTIGMGEDFDVNGNSAPWPGAPELPVEEAAGCVCAVTFNPA